MSKPVAPFSPDAFDDPSSTPDSPTSATPRSGRHRRIAPSRPERRSRNSGVSRLTAAAGVLALASGVVGFAASPRQDASNDVERAQLVHQVRGVSDPVAEAVAEAVAESRGERMTRSLARFEIRVEAVEAAEAIDEQIVVRAEEDAAAQARADAARKAKADAAREAAADAERKAKAEAQRKKAAAARAAAQPRWVLPVVGARLSAFFGDGGGLWANRHTGLDFAAPTGTAVRSVGAGTIVSAAWDGAYGRKIVVRHKDGTQTWYCHLSSFVRSGGTVTAGQLIGRVGSTGNTTGPHLHFEVHPGGGDAVNPLPWLNART